MKITKNQLRRIIKEEKAKLKEYGGRPYDPTVPGDYERYRDNPTGDAPHGGSSDDLYVNLTDQQEQALQGLETAIQACYDAKCKQADMDDTYAAVKDSQ